jgi:DNA modification methylase
VDKEIWTGRIVKQSSKDRNERRTGQIKGIRESIAGDKNSVSRKDDDLGFVRKNNRKSEQSLWLGFKKGFWTTTINQEAMKGEQDRIKALEKELQATKLALAEKTIALDVAETLIEKVNKHYSTDVKKILDRNSNTGTHGTQTQY